MCVCVYVNVRVCAHAQERERVCARAQACVRACVRASVYAHLITISSALLFSPTISSPSISNYTNPSMPSNNLLPSLDTCFIRSAPTPPPSTPIPHSPFFFSPLPLPCLFPPSFTGFSPSPPAFLPPFPLPFHNLCSPRRTKIQSKMSRRSRDGTCFS